MSNRAALLMCAVATSAVLAAPVPSARADGPGPSEPSEPSRDGAPTWGRLHREVSPRPPRRVTGGPGYVGSEWGLGKPSYYGIGTRPDWGRGSVD